MRTLFRNVYAPAPYDWLIDGEDTQANAAASTSAQMSLGGLQQRVPFSRSLTLRLVYGKSSHVDVAAVSSI